MKRNGFTSRTLGLERVWSLNQTRNQLLLMFSFLLQGIFSNNDYYCITITVFIHWEQKKKKLVLRENKCKNHDYCYIEMPEKNKIY